MDTNIKIRLAGLQDAPKLLEIYAPYVEKTAITFEYEIPSLQEFTGRIAKTLEGYPYLVAEKNGQIAGYAYAGPFHERAAYHWTAEISVYVKKEQKRAGIGSALYRELEKILAAQNILNLIACIACPQGEDPYLTLDSIAFHRYMGFRMAGELYQCGYKFGRWYNMVTMEKHIGEHRPGQPPVRLFSDIQSLFF